MVPFSNFVLFMMGCRGISSTSSSAFWFKSIIIQNKFIYQYALLLKISRALKYDKNYYLSLRYLQHCRKFSNFVLHLLKLKQRMTAVIITKTTFGINKILPL